VLRKLFKNPAKEQKKSSLDDVNLHIEEIEDAVSVVDGFPRIEWTRVRQATEPYFKHPGINQIWTELAAQWLGVVCRHLGESYQIYESRYLLMLSAQAKGEASRMLEVGDTAYERLEQVVQRSAKSRGSGKHVVLLFPKQSVYFDYISYFYPESDRPYGTSSGVHISKGYRHTALNGVNQNLLRTLVHELAHDMVYRRLLPRWLNEGFAQFAEDLVPGYRTPLIDHRQARLQWRYWSWFGMDHFWNGRAFSAVSSQRLSYQLSEILFRNLANDRARNAQIGTLLATADYHDAGQAAFKQCFGHSLSTLVEEFLGPGDWEPKFSEKLKDEPADEL
jgi:hypothetical protein